MDGQTIAEIIISAVVAGLAIASGVEIVKLYLKQRAGQEQEEELLPLPERQEKHQCLDQGTPHYNEQRIL